MEILFLGLYLGISAILFVKYFMTGVGYYTEYEFSVLDYAVFWPFTYVLPTLIELFAMMLGYVRVSEVDDDLKHIGYTWTRMNNS